MPDNEAELTAALAALRAKGVQALTQTQGPIVRRHGAHVAARALAHRMAWAGPDGDAERGALPGLSPDTSHLSPRAAYFIDRIARGAKPADLPIEQPTRFDFVINLKVARSVGITVPNALLLTPDDVIQ